MLVSILVNNFNYATFVKEAVLSVLDQSYQDFQIIIVDDGSTDTSRQVLEELAGQDPRIKVEFKENGGQLSAFNRGVELARGEVITFLDADDFYKEDYLKNIVDVYHEFKDCDFLFTGLEEFDQSRQNVIQNFPHRITDLGYTAFLTFFGYCWVGERTSAISMRRSLANKIFPIPLEDDWRIRADDSVIWLASLVGGRKFYLAEPLVNYRVHGSNLHFGKNECLEDKYRRRVQLAKFFGWVAENYPQFKHVRGDKLFRLLLSEAMTGCKNKALLHDYARCLNRFKKPFSVKHRIYVHKLFKHPVKFIEALKR
ncbi:MAG: glycosyltransferase family 2 protein [Syntrophotaleaceae bacterium]